jgi:hypothetical protein
LVEGILTHSIEVQCAEVGQLRVLLVGSSHLHQNLSKYAVGALVPNLKNE